MKPEHTHNKTGMKIEIVIRDKNGNIKHRETGKAEAINGNSN